MDDVTKLVKKLRTIDWRWDRQATESATANLGLIAEQRGATATTYRLADAALSVSITFQGQEGSFSEAQVSLKDFEIGEDLLQSEHFYQVLKEKTAEFHKDFRKTAGQITKVLGAPGFQGGADDPGYEEQDVTVLGAALLASWPMKHATLILKYDHQDKELPLTLELRVVPLRKPKRPPWMLTRG